MAIADACEAAATSDRGEALAFADLYAAAPGAVKAQLGLEVQRVADATLLLAPGMPSPMFNRAIGLGMERQADVASIAAIVEAYRSAGVQNWWLHWNPYAQPAELIDRLRMLGFVEPARRAWAKMLRGPTPPASAPTDLDILPADPAQAPQVAEVICRAFGMPAVMRDWLLALHVRTSWRVYAVVDAGNIVGGGCLFVDSQYAWLGMGAVLESHRRRGGQGALLARRICDAIALGCTRLVTETGEPIAEEANPSLANILRSGFERVASRLNLVGIASLPAGL